MIYNRRRTAITMIGMAWGIATVVLLLAYGAGFSRRPRGIFAEWGTHTIGVLSRPHQPTGRRRTRPACACASPWTTWTASPPGVPGIGHISARDWKDVPVQNDLHTYTWSVNGVRPEYQDILKMDIDQGRFFNGAEDQQRAHVCVIASESKTKLFSGAWALGEDIRLNGESFTVIGVLQPKMQESEDDVNRQIYIPFNTHERPEGHAIRRWHLAQLHRRQPIGREGPARDPGRRAPLPSLRPQRHLRRQPHVGAAPVQYLSLALQVLLSLVGALTLASPASAS